MPIYDIVCHACQYQGETLAVNSRTALICPVCGSKDIEKLISPTSSLTGRQAQSLPAAGDTTCCGRSPGEAGCQGPGSCCGKNQ